MTKPFLTNLRFDSKLNCVKESFSSPCFYYYYYSFLVLFDIGELEERTDI